MKDGVRDDSPDPLSALVGVPAELGEPLMPLPRRRLTNFLMALGLSLDRSVDEAVAVRIAICTSKSVVMPWAVAKWP